MILEHGGRRYPLAGGELVLGSDPGSHLVLAGVSARMAVVRPLGERMATIRLLDSAADVVVNGVAVGQEPSTLMHGDTIRAGPHELRVVNPAHPGGGPDAPPPGARERLHDTLFGMPKRAARPPGGAAQADRPAAAESPPPRRGRTGILIAAVVALAVLLVLFLL